ncbi:quinon protein alcohol dehydrogenase-like superfamily [Mycena albidolilacea]|uniref:Quinon protein alcohol dehydrogenase-like superfamily n=1 Tax=Mycena albidolilacea TaxID=1033008 RepID=A0AAD7A2X4_9AGAR|nr:quinon protein alcohol dehydrogenase-like superfamily [Mycena albidolilacea]
MSTFSKKSKTNKFSFYGFCAGHRGLVECLAVIEDGSLLASGGADGTRVWNLDTTKELQRPGGAGSRGATARNEPDIVFYGTQNGYLVAWKRTNSSISLPPLLASGAELATDGRSMYTARLVNPAEVTGLDFDAASNRLGSNLSSPSQSIISSQKPLHLGINKNTDREIMVFGLDDGNIHTLRRADGVIVKTRGVGGKMYSGNASINSRKGLLCVDDPFQGVAIYRLDDKHRVSTFNIKVTQPEPRPRQVRFANDGGFVVSGSDHGVVYIFDRWTGEILDKLGMGTADWVQTVTTADINGRSTVLAARSGELSGPNEIMIWRNIPNKKRVALPGLWSNVVSMLHILLVIAAILFFYKNMSWADVYKK